MKRFPGGCSLTVEKCGVDSWRVSAFGTDVCSAYLGDRRGGEQSSYMWKGNDEC